MVVCFFGVCDLFVVFLFRFSFSFLFSFSFGASKEEKGGGCRVVQKGVSTVGMTGNSWTRCTMKSSQGLHGLERLGARHHAVE